MRSFSERTIFDRRELHLLFCAQKLVDESPFETAGGNEIRCHELARAIGAILELPVCDGRFGFVEHSWLWLKDPEPDLVALGRWAIPHILDVYAVGSLPQVQLVDDSAGGLPKRYMPAEPRTDIDQQTVSRLTAEFRSIQLPGELR